MKILAKFVAIALLWPMMPAAGEDVPAPATPATTAPISSACELHVWPAAAMTIAFDPNGSLDDNAVIIKPMPGLDKDALMASATQNRLLAGMDLGRMLDLAGAKVVLHETPLPVDERRTNARRAHSAAPCYAELIVLRVVYAGILFGDRQLQTFFLFRRFDAGPIPTREFTQSGEMKLRIFPPHNAEPVAPALAELDEAFRSDVTIFSGKADAPATSSPSHRRIDW